MLIETTGVSTVTNKLRSWLHVDRTLEGDVLYPVVLQPNLDIYLLKPESSFISCRVVPGIRYHNGVLLEAVWAENRHRAQDERIVPLYDKTDVLRVQVFLREKYKLWSGNGSCVEQIWTNFKDIERA
jgi:hypothetical protein